MRRIILPHLYPAIGAGAVIAFFQSVENYNITLFTRGTADTLTVYVGSKIRTGITPTMNALALILILLTVAGCRLVRDLAPPRRAPGQAGDRRARGHGADRRPERRSSPPNSGECLADYTRRAFSIKMISLARYAGGPLTPVEAFPPQLEARRSPRRAASSFLRVSKSRFRDRLASRGAPVFRTHYAGCPVSAGRIVVRPDTRLERVLALPRITGSGLPSSARPGAFSLAICAARLFSG